jgi:hypothetical protein
MKKLFLLFSFFALPFFISAQEFGGNPPSIKWRQINTDTARILFPEGLDSTAQRVAAIVHYLAKNNPAPLGAVVRKVTIVLQGQTTVSNGYVGLAPFRSEYYLTPVLDNFDLGSTSWPEALAVHEYRHVEQFNNFRNGISRAAYYLFGEEGYLVASNASIPDWFYEGDAVYNETVTTNQGRGRLPFFLNQYKSLWIADKHYSWMKLRNGSLKDYVPNHYPLGYLLVNYGREKYGVDFWTKVTRDASAFHGIFYPFQKAIKRYSGMSYKNFREQAFDYYKNIAAGKDNIVAAANKENGVNVPVKKNTVANYYYPYETGKDSLVYLKETYSTLPAFYLRDAHGEHKIRTRDISLDHQYGYRNGKIVYAAYEPDARWNWRDYSVIKVLDLHTGEQRSLLHRTKYFTPDISPSGKLIAAIEIQPGGKNELHVLDAETGKLVQKFHSREVNIFTDPKFIDDSTLVIAVRLNDGRMALALADVQVGSVERLSTPSFSPVGSPYAANGMVYFTASYSGNDELYAISLKGHHLSRITQSPLGNYYPSVNGETLTWSYFTADGYRVRQMSLQIAGSNVMNDSIPQTAIPEFPVSHSNELHDILEKDIPNRNFSVEKYRQGHHLFYFHSWRPYFEDPDFTYSIYSDNMLNTLSTEFFYHYNRDEHTHGGGFSLLYGAWYAHLNGGMEYTFNRPVTIGGKKAMLDEMATRIGASIPFNFTKGKSFNFLTIGTEVSYNRQAFKGAYRDSLGSAGFAYLYHYLSWSQQKEKAVQHIYPRLGYRVSLEDRHAISRYNAYQWLTNGAIYLPGIYRNHSLVFTGSFQQAGTQDVIFANRFAGSRGYASYYFSRMWRLSGNYHFPIVYPDFGFGNIVYFQRVRGNLFYDLTRVYSADKTATVDLRSAGAEIYFDTRWWNEYPLSFGIRYSHLFDINITGSPNANVFEVVLPIVIPK